MIQYNEITTLVNKTETPQIRAGETHRFIDIWIVEVAGRLFCRQYAFGEKSWYHAFQKDPNGAIKCDNTIIKVKGIIPTDLDVVNPQINQAYLKKYSKSPYPDIAQQMTQPEYMAKTMELIPVEDMDAEIKTVLLINGHELYNFAKGAYNQRLFEEIEVVLSPYFEILKTKVSAGYDVKEEQEKFKKADLVIFQFPIYWFSVPALLKKYFDVVYEYGVFFGMGDGTKYGFDNGLMNGKKYMFSVTMNAPEHAFNEPDQFFEGRDTEAYLFNLHKTHQFCGLQGLESFAAYNIIKEPQIERDIERLREHLQNVVLKTAPVLVKE